MQALVLTAPNSFELRDVPTPMPAPGEVLVRVRACGICGSDVHGIDGSTGRRRPPIIMGHEAAGEIAALGNGVTAWDVGDRVTFDSTIYCGKCAFCNAGQINLCSDRRVLGVSCAEYRRDGAFAEYVTVPERVLHRVPAHVSYEHAALVEPLAVAVHAVAHASYVPNDSAVVIGVGMIGLLIVQVLRNQAYRNVIAVDVNKDRLALAQSFGAHTKLDARRHDVAAEVFRLTRGDGANVAFEVVGTADTVNTAIASVQKGGVVVLVGNVSPTVELPLQHVVTHEISLFGSCASAGEYATALKLLERGHVRVAPLISAVAPLRDGPEWFRRLQSREPGLNKVILQP